LAARIIAVADVWDALRSDRPYRKAWPEEKALEYIREQAGQHFDPQVVEVFLRVSGNETGMAGTGGTGENKDA
jgi:HD-GYP domain-containing protein (c-di-GMP phosphodiesterase class II)